MRAAVARLLAPGDQADPGGLPSGRFEPAPAQALAKNLQTLPAAELRLPRIGGELSASSTGPICDQSGCRRATVASEGFGMRDPKATPSRLCARSGGRLALRSDA
jgi:hypothetical protein